MIRLGKQSGHGVDTVLNRAEQFFGPESEWGLQIVERHDNSVRLEGGGGYVTVTAQPKGDGCDVDIVAQEWERQAQRFLMKV
jgi:hypothetical protein